MEVKRCLGRVRVIYDAVTPRGDSEIGEAYRDFRSPVVTRVEEQ